MSILPAGFGQTMREALHLVRDRDPRAATRLIRDALSGARAPAPLAALRLPDGWPERARPAPQAEPAPTPTARPRVGLGATLEALRKGRTPERRPAADDLAPGAFLAGDYVGAPGARSYKLYVPTHPAAPEDSRIVLMLHGCTQNPDDFALGARMNAVCEARGWFALYPEQTKAANFNRCWNWFQPSDQTAQRGEPAILAAMTRQIMAARDIRHAAVAGLSAGAAMALILGDVHPELFDAVLAHSGVAAGGARDLPSALTAMRSGPSPLPARPYGPRVMIVQGLADTTVAPRNADVIEASLALSGAVRDVVAEENGRTVQRRERRDADGRLALLSLRVPGLGHAWSGGSPAGTYTDPRGPGASEAFARFIEG